MVLLLALWNCISIPYEISFEPEKGHFYEFFEMVVDYTFAIDILVGFRTTYINSDTGFEEVEFKKIAMRYIISGRFFVDLAASIPFETVYLWFNPLPEVAVATGSGWQAAVAASMAEEEKNMELKLLGLLKLVRLLRLGRIVRYMKFKTNFKIGIRMF